MSALRNKSVVAVIDNLTAKEASRLSGAIQIKKALIAPNGRGRGAICDTDKKGDYLRSSAAGALCDKRRVKK